MNYLRHGTHIVPLITRPSPATLQSLGNQSFLECCRAKIVFLLHKHNSRLRIQKIEDRRSTLFQQPKLKMFKKQADVAVFLF